jgi:hypothetical protein
MNWETLSESDGKKMKARTVGNEYYGFSKWGRRFFLVVLCCLLSGCADLDKFSKDMANAVSYQDSVTGERTLGLMNEEQEIEQGEKVTSDLIKEFQKQGLSVDDDKDTLEKIRTMLNKITRVSHRPNLPWEIHILNTEQANAFALPGGKVFVLKGILGTLVMYDDELAGVIAHEVAHVTCRHQVREQAWSLIMPMIQKRARKEIYKASYTTIQEDEADRVGLLYMALAGYNPEAVYDIWKRADISYGSRPGNYLYDHSLNIDRANKVSQLIPFAKKYFMGRGVENINYTNLLLDNDLVPKRGFEGDSGFLAILELGLNTYTKYLDAKNEQIKREQEKSQSEYYLRFVRLSNIRKQPTSDGHIGLFVDITNLSNTHMKRVEVKIYYLDSANNVLYSDLQSLFNIPSAITVNTVFYLKNVPNYQNIGVGVSNVEF